MWLFCNGTPPKLRPQARLSRGIDPADVVFLKMRVSAVALIQQMWQIFLFCALQ